MTPAQAVGSLVDYKAIPNNIAPFDPSGLWDPGLRNFPPSRVAATRRRCGRVGREVRHLNHRVREGRGDGRDGIDSDERCRTAGVAPRELHGREDQSRAAVGSGTDLEEAQRIFDGAMATGER